MRSSIRRVQRVAAMLVFLALGATGTGGAAAAPPPTDPGLVYSHDTRWQVDDVPEVGAMEGTVRAVLTKNYVEYRGADGKRIAGFAPGSTYTYFQLPGWTPFYLYARDTATVLPMARFYYDADAMRTTVEEFLRLQYADGAISATVSPDFKVDKATVVSDEETSLILAAATAYRSVPETAWLGKPIAGQPVIARLNRAMAWLFATRSDPATGLIKRGHTTDWGDVKWETDGDPSHMEPADQWTASIYDQAITYGALQALATMDDAAGRPDDAQHWRDEAGVLRAGTDRLLWQGDAGRGYYRIHVHLSPDTIQHDVDEGAIVAIGNAAAVYYGLAGADKVPRILDALERARLEAGAPKVGLSLQPPYTGWHQSQMDQHVYQNGALWDWWAGRQISAEFWSGYQRLAREHLLGLAADWASHPGEVREWESPWINRTGADPRYAGAAAVVGQSVVEGLFGVDLTGRDVRLTPRLGQHSGSVRTYEPATDLYAAYRYVVTPSRVTLSYGSNSPTALSVRMPVLWRDRTVLRLDDKDTLSGIVERTGEDSDLLVIVPSGTHRIDMLRNRPGRRAF